MMERHFPKALEYIFDKDILFFDNKIRFVGIRDKNISLLKQCLDIEMEYPPTFPIGQRAGNPLKDLVENNILLSFSSTWHADKKEN